MCEDRMDRQMRLLEKAAMQKTMIKKEAPRVQTKLCPRCGYAFAKNLDICPNCQMKHTVSGQERQERLLSKAAAIAGTARSRRDTRVDDAKTQASLLPGTEEYKEYLKDIEESDPMREDDAFHEELEVYNESRREALLRIADERDGLDKKLDRSLQDTAEKLEMHSEVVASLADRAEATPEKSDDIAVSRITKGNAALADPEVSDEEYPEVLEEMVFSY